MRAIAKAMGSPPEVWFEEHLGEGRSIEEVEDLRGLAGRSSTCSRLSGTPRRESLTLTPRLLA
jgi:hypothetical protein